MKLISSLLALLKPELYRWRWAFYGLGVLWSFLAAATLIDGQFLHGISALAISAAYFCFYEKCLTWRAKP